MKILVIVVTYNAMPWIDRCATSVLAAGSSHQLDLFLVDNGSSDGTVSYVKERYPLALLHCSGQNLGFGKANNIGIGYAVRHGYDYAFLLNQDAWLQQGTMDRLVAVQQENPDYGILSPIHLNGDGSAVDQPFTNYMRPSNTEGIISDMVLGTPKEVYRTAFVNAAAWLLSMSCIRKNGGFDPLFFHYAEDSDYIYRVLKSGFHVGIVPGVYIHHDRVPPVQRKNGLFNANRENNRILLSMKHQDGIPDKSTLIKGMTISYLRWLLSLKRNRWFFDQHCMYKAKYKLHADVLRAIKTEETEEYAYLEVQV